MHVTWAPWAIRDVSDWVEGMPETRGLRAKRWIVDPDGTFWLRKSPRGRSPNESAIECLALRLAAASGLPTAEAWPCTWVEGGSVQRGIVIKKFLSSAEELHSGDQLIRGIDPSYNPDDRPTHTVARALAALRSVETEPGVLVDPFLKMLAFDFIVGNGDRHQGNWSIVRRGKTVSLAPMYDPAGCLGAELHGKHRLVTEEPTAAEIRAYAQRCPSGFGNESVLLHMHEVLGDLEEQAGWASALSEVRAAVRRGMEGLDGYLEQVPDDWYPVGFRRFGRLILQHRLSEQ